MKTCKRTQRVCLVLAGLTLASCGGSDSTSTTPPTVATSITVAGTAVQGSALAGATVTVKCATGNGTATTAANGAYSSTIASAALPCVVKVVGASGTTYHSLVAGTGSTGTFTANASPLTEMLVSHAAGTDPAAFFSAFGSTSTLPATSVTAANAYLQAALAGLTDLSGVNPLTDALVVGDALDQKIDAIVAGLAAAGITVADVTAAIVQNPTAPGVVAAPLAASATSCAWLKSGTYRIVARTETDPKYRFEKIEVNATALTAKDADNVVTPMTSDGSCQFNIDTPEDTDKVIASSGGMIVVHNQSKTVMADRRLYIGVPEQTLPVSEFAGTWNIATWEPANIGTAGTAVAFNAEITLDSTGQITAAKGCVGVLPCINDSAPFAKLVANSSGGFDVVESGTVVGRAFLYKTLTGRKVALTLTDDNMLGIGVPMNPLPAPNPVGTVSFSRSAQIDGNNNSATILTEDSFTITATDSTAKTITRLRTSDNRLDTLTLDKPRDGLRYRVGNSCTISGVPSNCAETVQLPLRGMGITMTLSAAPQPTPQFYQFSIDKP